MVPMQALQSRVLAIYFARAEKSEKGALRFLHFPPPTKNNINIICMARLFIININLMQGLCVCISSRFAVLIIITSLCTCVVQANK